MPPLRAFNSCLLAAAAVASIAHQKLPDNPFSIERLQEFPIISGRSPAAPAMSPDGDKIVFGWNQTGERKLDVWVMDFPSGRKRRIVEASKIEDLPRQDDARSDLEKKEAILYDGGIAGFTWSPDSKQICFSYKGRIWLVAPDGGDLHALFDANTGARSPQFSDDGKYIAYLQGQDVFRLDRKTGGIKQLTFVSKPLTTVDAFEWSPDSKNVIVFWSDSTKVGKAVMMDYSKDRGEVVNIKREWNGDLSENIQVGLVPADGGLIKFLDGLPHSAWLKNGAWSPDGSRYAFGWISDDFMNYTLTVVPSSRSRRRTSTPRRRPRTSSTTGGHWSGPAMGATCSSAPISSTRNSPTVQSWRWTPMARISNRSSPKVLTSARCPGQRIATESCS